MPGRVDNAGVFELLDDLQRRLADLERSSSLTRSGIAVTPSAAGSGNAKGCIIVDGSLAERVRLGATDTDASPAAAAGLYGVSAKDGSGRVRALFGQIPSGDGYGAAAYDAAGNVIFDSNGLVATVTPTVTENTAGSTQTMPASSTTPVTGGRFAFTVPTGRTCNILLLGTLNAQVQTGNGGSPTQNVYFQVAGQSRSNRGYIPYLTNSVGFAPQGTATLWQLLTLPGGSYTGDWYFVNPFPGTALSVVIGDVATVSLRLGG